MVKSAGEGDRLKAALAAAIPKERARTVVLNVRLSPEEAAALRDEAERQGIAPASLARLLVTEGLAIISTGQARP